MSSSEEITNRYLEICVGASIVILSFVFCILYVPIVIIFLTDKEYSQSRAYTIMTWIGITDILQLIIHLYSGILVINDIDVTKDMINKITGAVLTGLWDCMLMLMLFLNVNRVIEILFSRYSSYTVTTYIYRFCYLLCFLMFLACCILKLLPRNNYIFITQQLYWGPLIDDNEVATVMLYVGNYLVLLVVICSLLTYSAIFIYIALKTQSKLTKVERRLTIQISLLLLYFLFTYVYWTYIMSFFPSNYISHSVSLLIWIVMNGIHPIIYLVFNKRLRKSFLIFFRQLMSLQNPRKPNQWTTTISRQLHSSH
ncbi:unnamed protein product [Auanema sp. JU1783]|nr:unnamed protein product [Auanema sp. JU1783]